MHWRSYFGQMTQHSAWRGLWLFNCYRLTVATLLLLFYVFSVPHLDLGHFQPNVYVKGSGVYLLLVSASFLALVWHWPRSEWQLFFMVVMDIVLLTILLHASNGVNSGIGVLINISIACGSILTGGRVSLLFAAIATMSIIGEQAIAQVLLDRVGMVDHLHAGMLGLTFFATALLGQALSVRIRQTEALASEQQRDLDKLSQLNEFIIQRMRSGVLIVDADQNVVLMNDTARRFLLGVTNPSPAALPTVSPELTSILTNWQHSPVQPHFLLKSTNADQEILGYFSNLVHEDETITLIFLEDASRTTQYAQQMKLASLGRLTASIAHEVRNPLSAISHAVQLLGELELPDKRVTKFVDIIYRNAGRVNAIITNILSLSKQRTTHAERIIVLPWLKQFMGDFLASYPSEAADILIDVAPEDLAIQFDPAQLVQVLTNLFENGLRYSQQYSGRPVLQIATYFDPAQYVVMDIIDAGPGVEDTILDQIFEPFFTTDRTGTGLGLYVVKEMCEANRATITAINMAAGGCCFRLRFYDQPIQ